MRRSAALLAVLALAVLAATAGCRPASDAAESVGLAWNVSPDTPAAGSASFDIRLTDKASGRPLTGATVKLEGNMTHPGMQPVFSTARETVPGRYDATMSFTMAGDWVILLDATLPDRRTVHRQVDLRGVRVP